MSTSVVTQELLHAFHKADREIFTRMVVNLMRNPAESLLIMALWLWLEEKGFNIVLQLKRLPECILNAFADETALCLKCLDANNCVKAISRFAPRGLIVTARLLDKEIPLQVFCEHRYTIISGIKNYLTNICARVFTDILQRVLAPNPLGLIDPDEPPVTVPGFPHRIFGSLRILDPATTTIDHATFPTGGLWGWGPNIDMSVDDRTMFLTFSRGFPVSENEVRQLFIDLLGFYNCVESVQMENVPPNEQPLYAKMVFICVIFVDRILRGNKVSKFRINGKHIWARKYERRE